MKFAYADPPYYGMASRYDHPDTAIYDTLEGHEALFARMEREFDYWAYSLSAKTLPDILPLAPSGVRVMAWVKPFASFKPNVNPAWAWEPVIVKGRNLGRGRTVRDWVSCNMAMHKGFFGAKPEGFAFWIFEVLGAEPSDEFTDLFPGSGAVTRAWDDWCRYRDLLVGVS